MKNVYLVGFMGSGKSSVGKILAESLGVEFVEMDDLIEQREGQSIVDIFSHKGESYFRKLESSLLEEIASKNNLVVSCGGGLICNDKNLKTLKDSGIVITLKASAQCIYERVKNQTHRPLLNVKDPLIQIRHLLDKREVYYLKADYVIDTDSLKIEEVVKVIKNKLNNG